MSVKAVIPERAGPLPFIKVPTMFGSAGSKTLLITEGRK